MTKLQIGRSPNYPGGKGFRPRERKLYETIRDSKNVVDTFGQALIIGATDNTDGTRLTGTTGEVASFHSGKFNYEQYMAATSSVDSAAVAQIVSLECRADSSDDLDGTWFAIYTPTAPIVFWYDVDNSGTTVPSHGLAGAVEVEISGVATDDTAATVATVTEAIIEANGFSSSVATATITITCDESGQADAPNAGTAAHTSLSTTTTGKNAISADADNLKTPFQSSSGLELPPLAAGDALEVTNGITSLAPVSRTIDTDEAWFIEASIKIDDISDVTELFYGVRKAEAYQADPDNYDEMAAFNVGKDADGQIEIHTILNNAATSETDTTLTDWADGNEKTLKIIVKKNGHCEFYVDGSIPTVTTTFKFDSGEVLVPFLHVNTETGDPGVSISSWKVGTL